MLRSRVVSEGVRTVWPLATSGIEKCRRSRPTWHARTSTLARRWKAEVEAPSDARQAINDAVPMRAAAAATPRAPRRADPVVYDTAPDPLNPNPMGGSELLNLDVALANAQSQDEVVQIGGHASVGHATANAPEHVKRRVSESCWPRPTPVFAPEASNLDDVAIVGEEKVWRQDSPETNRAGAALLECHASP